MENYPTRQQLHRFQEKKRKQSKSAFPSGSWTALEIIVHFLSPVSFWGLWVLPVTFHGTIYQTSFKCLGVGGAPEGWTRVGSSTSTG